ncbi:hypothetical protein [Maritalea porphyrae]|uniref:hypothetical protein n=1 Tax=Maritalea porphyrae TaxID=880732 RepID=UPI0022AEA79C|nr:hypothetical protein [Maritalea porphyrae]MCZ4274011.1 hypothetical protein [Maritalea porphyrae]
MSEQHFEMQFPSAVELSMEVELAALKAERDEYRRQARLSYGFIEHLTDLLETRGAFTADLPNGRRVKVEVLVYSETGGDM